MKTKNDLTIGIIINIFFPGLGNIIFGQKKFGIFVLCISALLTIFYFIPPISFAFNGNDALIMLIITSILAVIAFAIDIFLIVISIRELLKLNR